MKDIIHKPVLVVGGGIGGIQAAHDLAEMNIPVILVEKSPSIGGRMAQLDKTFPTNDCSACILAPKVTDTFNHPLVSTMTWSEVEEIQGEAPDFTAVIRQRARYVDMGKCTGCGDCTTACPVEVKSEFDMGVGNRRAVYKPFAQAAPNKVVIDKKGTSPCKFRCPAHMDAHGYIALAGQGRWDEALGVVRRVTPFAGVLGRVCFHPCESQCSRRFSEEPLAIAGIKRYIADRAYSSGSRPPVVIAGKPKDTKIAVIGAGPAGLNCAYTLAREGYQVTVLERLPEGGGMLRVGIPDYRLDKKILKDEISIIEAMGVEFRYHTAVGETLTLDDLRAEGFSAFFLAIGAHGDRKLNIPGEDAQGVIPGIEFLRAVNLGEPIQIGERVLVVGGGNVAMDAARSALRLGARVTVVYRRTREEMPANPWEIEEAMEEGVEFRFLASQEEVVVKEGTVIGLRCLQNQLGAPDASGRRRPEAVPGSDFILEADTILVAAGQQVEQGLQKAGFDGFRRDGTIATEDCRTSVADVFAGGDAESGPAAMIDAVAAGNRAAKAIINYLEGRNDPIDPFLLPKTEISQVDMKRIRPQSRAAMPVIDLDTRRSSFREVEMGFDEEAARKEALRCVDCSICSECLACVSACQSGAICHTQQDKVIEVPVSAVVLCLGYDMATEIPPELGYEANEDVVTSMEYERILSASGPYAGHVKRPSDGRAPERIAFIQCVGSRDHNCGADYCSAVCCMYAVKEAQITREHLPSVRDIDIYYMDMRAYGKDFDRYVQSGEQKYGIRFIRSRVGGVSRLEDGRLMLKSCAPDGTYTEAAYDLVVLSTGFQAREENISLLRRTGIRTDRYGFIACDPFSAPATSMEGIFACGAAAGPKDIPETVTEASAVASGAAVIAKDTEAEAADYADYFAAETVVPPRDVSMEPIRMGVFVCRCGINIGGYVDVPAVCDHVRTLPHVVHVEDSLYTCSVDAQKNMMELIEKHKLNRVVVASCTPRTHEPLFQNVLRKTGLNPYLFNMSNIRDQCSWVHMNDKAAATEKAKQLVRMAVGKGICSTALNGKKIAVEPSVLVLGGGMAGISAALATADMGFQAILVERSGDLGGNARHFNALYNGRPISDHVKKAVDTAVNHPNILVCLNTEVLQIEGFVGNFKTSLKRGEEALTVNHGAVIVATGAGEQRPTEYGYGEDERVMTQMQLDQLLQGGDKRLGKLNHVVMIQCVGSREEGRMYCSRVCCNQALRNAAALRRLNPEIKVTILYRDLRAYGMYELDYQDARRNGTSFLRYDPERKPRVEVGDSLTVTAYDEVGGGEVSLPADLLVLASAIVPDLEGSRAIAQMLKIPLTQDGFFLEAHAKLRPVDFATEGVYVCGLAHSPRNLKECIVQGRAAAGRVATVLSKDAIETAGTIAQVDGGLCSACGVCEAVCAYGAVAVQDVPVRGGTVRRAVVNEALCKGCGTCAANCRCGAIDVGGFSDRQIVNEIEFLLRRQRVGE